MATGLGNGAGMAGAGALGTGAVAGIAAGVSGSPSAANPRISTRSCGTLAGTAKTGLISPVKARFL